MFNISQEELVEKVSSSHDSQIKKKGSELYQETMALQDSLLTSFTDGLSKDNFSERLSYFGQNCNQSQKLSFLNAFFQILKHPIVIFYLALSTLSIFLSVLSNGWYHSIESIAIFSLLILDNIISARETKQQNNLQSEQQLYEESSNIVIVYREGKQLEIQVSALAVGDLVILQEGDTVPADGVLISAAEMCVDESTLTGETIPANKLGIEQINKEAEEQISLSTVYLYKSTKIVQGEGKFVVLAVGGQTMMERICNLVRIESNESPLEQAIKNYSKKLTKVEYLGILTITLILITRLIFHFSDEKVICSRAIANIINLFIVLASYNFLKSLALHHTITLAWSVKNMLRSNSLVRRLKKIENLAYMDQILIDKTGTLTQNRMVFDSVWNDQLTQINRNSSSFYQQLPEQLRDLLGQCLFINNAVRSYGHGSATDRALYETSQDWKYDANEIEKQQGYNKIFIPFTSMRKRVTSVIKNRILVRGASELILSYSTKYYSQANGICLLTDQLKKDLELQLEPIQGSHRIQALAYKDIDRSQNQEELVASNEFDQDKSDLIIIGFAAFRDPLRCTTIQTIKTLGEAGITVKMITGDNLTTAKNVALECGIMKENSVAMEGPQFICGVENQKGQFSEEIESISVLARSRPEDKLRFLTELQARNHVVGVTGDGTNDAPALSKADIGISLGISGTEVARESSDIILLDDNIQSILTSVMFGRNIFDSLKKFTQYQVILNLSLYIVLIISTFGETLAFSPLQLIWINTLIELLASIIITQTTQINQSILQRKPNRKGELGIDISIVTHIVILTMYPIVVIWIFGNSNVLSFNIFVLVTLFNILSSTKLQLELNPFEGLFKSLIAMGIFTGIIVLQLAIVEFGGFVMQTGNGLTIQEWLLCFAIGFGSFIYRALAIIIVRLLFVSLFLMLQSIDRDKLKVE